MPSRKSELDFIFENGVRPVDKKEYSRIYGRYRRRYHREKVNREMVEHRKRHGDKRRKYETSYYWRNRDRILAHDRKHELKGGANGTVYTGLNKRDYTGYCEICGKEQLYRLNYHHWDETNPSKGMWVCVRCHTVCEGMDKQLGGKYMILKSQIDEVYKNGLEN